MQFRKKPVVIEAEKFHPLEPFPFRDNGVVRFGCNCGEDARCSLCGRFWVQTLEGPLAVSDGDWIIRGVKGEFYPCKPDIFAETYETLEESQADNAVAQGRTVL